MRAFLDRWSFLAACALTSCSSNAARISDAGAGPCNGLPGLKITFLHGANFGLGPSSQWSLKVTYANNQTQDLTSAITAPIDSLSTVTVTSAYGAVAIAGSATATFYQYGQPDAEGRVSVTVNLQSCTDFAIPLYDGMEVDAHPPSDATVPVDAGAALTWYFTCPDGICTAPLDAGLTDDGGSPCPTVGTSCTTLGQACGTSNPGVHCGATEVCDDHDPTTDNHGCPI